MLKIGIFDSGLGGLTVLQAISKVIKGAELFYIADTKNAPYGDKTTKEILQYSLDITEYFLNNHHIDALVIACNTATSASISTLRKLYPNLIIVGTEPAVKPAIEQTKTAKVGVLATPATLRGDKYQSLIKNLTTSKDVELYEQACAGLVEHIENQTLKSKESMELLKRWLLPMKKANVDTIVLGCTHYPLASSVIEEIMSKDIILLDSGRAIANRLLALLKEVGYKNSGELELNLYATGDIDRDFVDRLIGKSINTIDL